MLGLKTAAGLVGLIVLSACGTPTKVVSVPVPQVEVLCPDPASRTRLSEGSTYRDLALSRSEALAGWRLCAASVEALKK